MRDIVSVSLPSDCKLLDDVKKHYTGGVPTSVIFREALQALLEKKGSDDIDVQLPSWKQFDKALVEANPEKFKAIVFRLTQLNSTLERRRSKILRQYGT